jgi:ATP-dependent RNA helicase RhlE
VRFEDLQLIEPLVRAVHAEGYDRPTPIQERAIPEILAGRDLCGVAQTGTGKTAAFALPILQRLSATRHHGAARHIRVLVLSPTRELASQIGESFSVYGRHTGITNTVIFGGVGQEPQTQALRRGMDVLVATPGRLLDLMQQGYVKLDRLEVFVLDEADRMLDMGFIHDVRRVIAALPRQRQTLLFSATMPTDIQELARTILIDPVRVEVTPVATTADKIEQWIYFVEKADKRALLADLLEDPEIAKVLVFTRTKHGANRVAEQLGKIRIGAEAIHGNKSQGARERALRNFKSGETRVLVATDIAARGIDVEGITHVINYDLPNVPEQYVHRIGRTARAGASGIALSFCDQEERAYLVDIERLIKQHIPDVVDHPFRSPIPRPAPTNLHGHGPQRGHAPKPQQQSQHRGGGGGGGRRRRRR